MTHDYHNDDNGNNNDDDDEDDDDDDDDEYGNAYGYGEDDYHGDKKTAGSSWWALRAKLECRPSMGYEALR